MENSAMAYFFRYITDVILENSAMAYSFRYTAEQLHSTVILSGREYFLSTIASLPLGIPSRRKGHPPAE